VPGVANIPAAEVAVDAPLVRRLLAAKCPWLDGPVTPFAHGWDNELFALGSSRLVRLPRRAAASGLIDHEIAWLPRLAGLVDTPLPVPEFAGSPSAEYPWRWTVVPRLPGACAAGVAVAARGAAAPELARFLVGLHVPAPAEAPANPFRGVPLAVRRETMLARVDAACGSWGVERWVADAAAPPWPGPPVWLHGDPHPLNLLLDDTGALAGVVDFGDLCSGDPASDLAVAWLAFDAPGRARFRDTCDRLGRYDPGVWRRARAWALGLAAVFAAHSDDQPLLADVARHGLAEIRAEAAA
jgi:aminoglycoside phosphotransferase (APT) family kinase protein